MEHLRRVDVNQVRPTVSTDRNLQLTRRKNMAKSDRMKVHSIMSYCRVQADIATLMASLIGVSIPVNSVVSKQKNIKLTLNLLHFALLRLPDLQQTKVILELISYLVREKCTISTSVYMHFFLRASYLFCTSTTVTSSRQRACTLMLFKY